MMVLRTFFRIHPRQNAADNGFTLVELLVIVAILSALVAIAIPTYFSYIDKAKITLAVSSLENLRSSIESFHLENNEYPKPPVDFMNTGLDANGRSVLDQILISQLQQDILSIDSYIISAGTWTITARAKDKGNTTLTLTQIGITR